jgi:formyltetrahydrofolate deformylase
MGTGARGGARHGLRRADIGWVCVAVVSESTARLVVVCPDSPGIVAAISAFLFARGANITDSAQHSTDPVQGTFFMRMEFVLPGFEADRRAIEDAFEQEVARRFDMTWRFSQSRRPRVAILVSRPEHCLVDLLWRWRRQELRGEITLVISNHLDHEETVGGFDVDFAHVPFDDKILAEATMLDLLRPVADVVVLARYMRILSSSFLEQLGVPAINIHHSFLPAFVGADPYQRALDRGVKLIGATAHYVTEELDDGPIIEQDIARVSHRHTLRDLEQIGRDVERTVLARALAWHLEDRVVTHGKKTYVFE